MRLPDGGFPYAPGLKSAVEPTIHAVLAGLGGGVDQREITDSIRWLSGKRNRDGSVACSPDFPEQGLWLTAPYALAMKKAGDDVSASAAIEFLITYTSITVKDPLANDLDGSLVGWPWAKDSFSWVEPTAWSLLALYASGRGEDPRAVEGRKLLGDRQIHAGGWNYGNKIVYGQELIPFADTTALALLALFGRVPETSIEESLKFLERDSKTQESPYALALAGLALRRCRRTDAEPVVQRLESKMNLIQGESLNVVHLAFALQALGKRGVIWE